MGIEVVECKSGRNGEHEWKSLISWCKRCGAYKHDAIKGGCASQPAVDSTSANKHMPPPEQLNAAYDIDYPPAERRLDFQWCRDVRGAYMSGWAAALRHV